MKKLLLIMGDLATGKSTFAHILSKRYDTNIFFKDSMKEVLGDTIGFSNREENLKLSKAAMELLFFLFAEFGKLNKNLILESNFHTEELERFHKMADGMGYEVLTLVLRGDAEILHKRFLNRIYNENRHPVHLSAKVMAFDEFESYIVQTRKERIPGRTININADSFAYQTEDALLKCIDEFIGL